MMDDRMPTDAQAWTLERLFRLDGLRRAVNSWDSTGRGTAACLRLGWAEMVEVEVMVLGDMPVVEVYMVPTPAGQRARTRYREAHQVAWGHAR